MIFEVELGGRTRRVAIDRADRPGRFRVTVDGEVHLLDVVRTGEFGLSVLGRPVSPGDNGRVLHSSDLHVTPAAGFGELLLYLAGRTASATVNGRRTGHAAEAGAHGAGEIAITAPMPGRVVRVLVAPGDEVTARQGIVVVEAMKMENELRAPRAGRIREVGVTVGTSVDAGRVLAVIE
jgi:biotin carboxyl carrier protein